MEGLEVRPLAQLPQSLEGYGLKMAILAVPAEAAQEVADAIVQSGVGGRGVLPQLA